MSDISLDISDLTYKYEDIEKVESYQTYIASKYEFSSLKDDRKYKGLFKHQEVIKRLILFVDKILLFHKTGTGKGCAGTGASEQFANDFLSLVDDFAENYISTNRTTIKRIFFLTKGPTLINSARKELVCTCSFDKSKYLTEEVLQSTTDKIFRSRLKKEVNKYTTFETYYKFASSITDETTDEDIIKEFSNCFFICDEIQTLSVEEGEDFEISTKKSKEYEENRKIYSVLHRIFHLIKNSKIVLMTATPMIDKPKEIEGPMNLILPLNKQMDFKDYSKVELEDLRPYFHGNISYVTDLQQKGAKGEEITPVLEGESISAKKIKIISEYSNIDPDYIEETKKTGTKVHVVKNEMSEYQEEVYEKVVARAQGKFYSKERQILNITFPDEDYEGDLPKISNHINRLGPDRYVFKGKKITKETLKFYAPKIDDIINECINNSGNRFAFSNFVKSGVIPMTAGFRLYGVEQYIGTTSAFSGSKKMNQKYCVFHDEQEQINKRIVIDKKLRFAVISTETTQVQIDRIFELYNSYENRYGEYIKIIIGSPKTQIGISLKSVTGMHVLDAHWNSSNRYQASSRGFRRGSLDYIIDQLDSMPKIFLHCSVMDDTFPTIDEILYVRAEQKDIQVKRVERMLKILAADCRINNRFIGKSEADYSPLCDYQLCNYSCNEQQTIDTQYDSFDVLYSNELLDEIIIEIKNIFVNNFVISIYQLINFLVPKYTFKQVLLAVEKLYDQKNQIINRFGFESYLQMRGTYLIIYNKYPEIEKSEDSVIPMTNYSQINMFIRKNNTIDDFVNIINENEVNAFIKKYKDSEQINLEELSIEKQSLLLEHFVIADINSRSDRKKSKLETYVLKHFRNYISEYTYPSNAISELKKYFEFRKRKKVSVHSKFLDAIDYSGSDTVILNNLLSNSTDRASYRVTVKTISSGLRILNVSKLKKGLTRSFRDANVFETTAFNYILSRKGEEENDKIKNAKLYGTISHADKNFRLFLDEGTVTKEEDSRTKLRGRKCMTFGVAKLIELLLQFDVSDEDVSNFKVSLSKAELISFLANKDVPHDLLKDSSITYLKTFYNWITRKSKDEICDMLMQKLKEEGLLVKT